MCRVYFNLLSSLVVSRFSGQNEGFPVQPDAAVGHHLVCNLRSAEIFSLDKTCLTHRGFESLLNRKVQIYKRAHYQS